jgi:hypothetical protein
LRIAVLAGRVNVFEPEKLLKGLKLQSMTTEQAIQEIKRLADESPANMSPGYYQQKLGAISILSHIAAERLKERLKDDH